MDEQTIIISFLITISGVFLLFIIWALFEELWMLLTGFLPTKEKLNNEFCISFSQFLNFYSLCPDKWDITTSNYRPFYGYISIFFSHNIDIWKYRQWLKDKEQTKKTQKLIDTTEAFCEAIRKDIRGGN